MFTENNIAYTHITCTSVSKQILKQENRAMEYEVGEMILCKSRTKLKNNLMNVRFEYKTINVYDTIITIRDTYCHEIFQVNITIIKETLQIQLLG
jgi:uncharacterized protein with HEPN domain